MGVAFLIELDGPFPESIQQSTILGLALITDTVNPQIERLLVF